MNKGNRNNSTNTTFASFTESCLASYNPVACSRDILESVFALLTIIGCSYKLFKLHAAKHKLLNQYLIFYGAILEILLLLINWIYVHHPSFDLVAELLKLFQFLVVCRFYCEVASRISKTEYHYKRICIPFLILTSAYYITLIIVSIVRMRKEYGCQEPEWLQLSCSEVILGFIFIIVGLYITNHINNLKTDVTFKRNIRLSLWGIILSFEFSSIISATYDILMLIYGKMNGCRGVFIEHAALYTSIHIFIKLSKWLLPIWAMMVIFKPETFGTKNTGNEEDVIDEPPIIRNSLMGDFKSEFRPRNRSFNYKHLRDPDNVDERRLLSDRQPKAENETPGKKKRNKSTKSRNSDSKGSSNGSLHNGEGPRQQRDYNKNQSRMVKAGVINALDPALNV